MASETEFLNGALGLIGASSIVNINDGSPNANRCRESYPMLRKAWLRSHHWNFAEDRMELVADPTPPAFEYSFKYPLPDYILKVKEYNGILTSYDPGLDAWILPGRFKTEGRNLLTNDGSAKIVFIRDIDNPTLWDPLFYQFLQHVVASYLANSIAKNANKAATLMNTAVTALLPIASAVDGQEGSPQQYIVDDLYRGR